MGRSLYQKVWDQHVVRELPNGQSQVFVGLHLVHEVTSPEAFSMLRERGLAVARPDLTVATIDHVLPTDGAARPLRDPLAEEMVVALETACREFGVRLLDRASGRQGVVHVTVPELGLTRPGMVIACGDSHTSTHGAFGALGFGIGTTQVRDVLATQTLCLAPLRVRRIEVRGRLRAGVSAKDLALHLLRVFGVDAGVGYAHEYGGEAVEALGMEERMTLCNMAVEGGARVGYVNPDETTFAYLRGRTFAPAPERWDEAVAWWRSLASDEDAVYDDVVRVDARDVAPTVTWGVNPGQAIAVDERVPDPRSGRTPSEQAAIADALAYMGLEAGAPVAGTAVDVAFIGSCTNGRLSDLREVARHLAGHRVAPGVRALVVPGSMEVARLAESEGLDRVFREAGFEWRQAGCSMCLAMNPDRLSGRELCASSSNRNFKGRQGSPTGRTMLMSPLMVAAAAVRGRVSDVREVFGVA